MRPAPALAALAVCGVALVACSPATNDGSPRIVETLDRQPTFTQGLELLGDGTIVHSRGKYGESGIDILSASGEVLNSRDLPDDEFGEGVTVVHDSNWNGEFGSGNPTAYQLTWKSGVVHTWSVPDLVEGPTLQIEGEGWGICYDDSRHALWQSDGSSTLRLLSVRNLAPMAEVTVRETAGAGGAEVSGLNELECEGSTVWANIWKSDDIVEIELSTPDGTATVMDRISLTELVDAEEPEDAEDVLNGLAFEPQDGTLLATGKNWEHIYRVELFED